MNKREEYIIINGKVYATSSYKDAKRQERINTLKDVGEIMVGTIMVLTGLFIAGRLLGSIVIRSITE